MKKVLFILLLAVSNFSFSQNIKKPGNTKEIENAINTLAQNLALNPENPLKINNDFLSTISQLIDDKTLKSTLQSYSTNLGKDGDLSYRQVYWDLAKAFDQYPSIANNSRYQETRQGLGLMFENYDLLSNKLKSISGNYEFGAFINDPAIINSLTTITGSYENAQAIGMGVELAAIFTEAFTAGEKFKEDYMKLASLSTKNAYAETDINLTSALIDSYVGIEAFQVITPMYRYDFNNGASLRVENGILKYFNSKKGIVKNLMVVDKRHDGSFYKVKDIRGVAFSTILVSPDEKAAYLFVNPKAISDVKCETCLEKSGYSIDTDNGEIIYSGNGSIFYQSGQNNIQFTDDNIPIVYTVAAGGPFAVWGFPFASDEKIMANRILSSYTLTYLDRHKNFLINNRERKFKDGNSLQAPIFNLRSKYFYLFKKDSLINRRLE